MGKTLKYSAISGLITLTSLISYAYLGIFSKAGKIIGLKIYVLSLTHLSYLIFGLIFLWGFWIVSELYQNKLLKLCSVALAATSVLSTCFKISILFYPNLPWLFISRIFLIIAGLIFIPFGFSLLKLDKEIRGITKTTAISEIRREIRFAYFPFLGLLWISIMRNAVYALLGLLFCVVLPAVLTILGSILLFKVYKINHKAEIVEKRKAGLGVKF